MPDPEPYAEPDPASDPELSVEDDLADLIKQMWSFEQRKRLKDRIATAPSLVEERLFRDL